jgi:alpha-ribazole phosphatase
MRTTVILVRHGQTEWNAKKRLQGQTDLPLTKKGLEQAHAVAKRAARFPINVVYSSDLIRAKKTAEIIGLELNLPVIVDKRFNERDFGDWEGNNWEEMEKLIGKNREDLRTSTPPNGESLQDFAKRVTKILDEVIKKEAGKTILVVCHAGVLHSLVRHLKNIPQETVTAFSFPNTSVSVFHVEKDLVVEELLSDASHL